MAFATKSIFDDAVDGFGNIIATAAEWAVTDRFEGKIVRKLLERDGYSIPASLYNAILGKGFQIRKHNRDVIVQTDEGVIKDLFGVALGALNVVAVVSPGKGAGAYLFAKAFPAANTITGMLRTLKILKRTEEFKQEIDVAIGTVTRQMETHLVILKCQVF
ncbi:hypothetical protein [Chitinophaga silvisoli]|uniref:Uncharacterized protein n=1 Tax=Chitinophaga silvisoli TaxID=2291814 RepID=A0A3E1NZK5_9BACT|nr:hypothetical protein [Chitinophaga silvisoli]RFM33178.1 hypothetical protein DXN04_19295 [Chitinophaga silvisoli]